MEKSIDFWAGMTYFVGKQGALDSRSKTPLPINSFLERGAVNRINASCAMPPILSMNSTKKCPKCQKIKDVSEFHTRTLRGKTVLRSWCILCDNESSISYKRSHVEEIAAYWEGYRDKRNAKRREKNFERATERRNRRNAQKQAIGTHTKEDIAFLLAAQKSRCAKCGSKLNPDIPRSVHVDHIVPISKKGGNGISNLQILCATCNLQKHDKTADYRTKSVKDKIARYSQRSLF